MIEEGTLKAGKLNALLNASNTEIFAGATFDLAGFSQFMNGRMTGSGNIDNTGAAAVSLTIDVSAGQSGTLSGLITDTGGNLSLAKTGNGALTLTGVNSYAGTTSIFGGTLEIAGPGTGNPLSTGAVINNAHLLFSKTASSTVGNVISGSGDVTKINGVTLTLTGDNTYSGGTTIEAGTLRIGNGGTTGTAGTGAIVNNAFLEFNRSDAFTVSNLISGSGELSVNGSGQMTLSAANTYTGATSILAGTLKAGAANIIAASSDLIVVGGAGGTFDLAGFSQSGRRAASGQWHHRQQRRRRCHADDQCCTRVGWHILRRHLRQRR